MAARWSAAIVWAALAASLVFWVLRLGARPDALPVQAQTVASDQSARGDILRLFANPAVPDGPAPGQPDVSGRLRLLGVIAGVDDEARGWAVLSLDGKPARTLKVGAAVEGEWVVQSVTRQRVRIGPVGGAPVATLDLPLPAPPATGQLPGIGDAGGEAVGAPGATPGVLPARSITVPPAAPPPVPDADTVADGAQPGGAEVGAAGDVGDSPPDAPAGRVPAGRAPPNR